MLDKDKRRKIVLQAYNFVELLNKCDTARFRALLFHNRPLHHLYQVKQQILCVTMRRRGHNFTLPVFRYQLAKSSLINRYLYCYAYIF